LAVERQEYWQNFFRAAEDPWHCDNPYENTKYEQTLELLPASTIENALELACAEGHFTARFASHVDRLIAADISPTALGRARSRCADVHNVQFQLLDFLSDELPHDLDLLVCSEALYYASLEQLASLPGKFATALKLHGHLLMAHACTIADERDRTGFDWGDHFGAKRIADAFSGCPLLALKKELRTELYRIQLFQRIDLGADPLPPPEIIETAPAAFLPVYVEAAIIWGGAIVTRVEARDRESAREVPILMYHSIADSGPPELGRYRVSLHAFRDHLRFLRRHGYYSVSLSEWARCIANGELMPGRPVIITFDDGYRDFITHAAPLLEAADFRATVFVVAGKVGATADWDKTSWPSLRLLEWDDLRDLRRRGFEIGSHTSTHTDLRALSEEEILTDARKVRTIFHEQLGCDVDIVSFPWGRSDARIRMAFARTGYYAAVTTEHGCSSLSDDPLYLPRIEITGANTADGFARLLKEGHEALQGGAPQPRFGPDVHLELVLLRAQLRAAETEAFSERSRADTAEESVRAGCARTAFAEAEASLQRMSAEATERLVRDETARADAAQGQLEQALIRLRAIESSTTWRAMAPLRSWFSTRPSLARSARRIAKVLWWSATLQLPGKVSEVLLRRRASTAGGCPAAHAVPVETSLESSPTSKDPARDRQPGTVAAPPPIFPTLGASLLSDIPIIVCSFNNLTYLRNMLAQLRARGLSNLIVIDNASSAPDMNEYLCAIATTIKVVRAPENIGPHYIFLSEAAYRWLPDLFCLTDPDLSFNPDLPGNFLEELAELTERFEIGKAGFALDISNREAMRHEPFEIAERSYRIWEWEEQFWQHEIGATSGGDPIFRAIIDTTFALYNKRYFDRGTPLDAVRVAGRFTCRHLPWYHDHGMPEAEAETYRTTQRFSYYMRSDKQQRLSLPVKSSSV
jgi:peptidoglycan/xylan/chitin deacetylase (PgdA/CDA1 family)